MNSATEPLSYCPVCTGRRLRYAFSLHEGRAVRCADCQFLFLNPPPCSSDCLPSASSVSLAEARHHFAQVIRYRGSSGGRLLLIGHSSSPLHSAALEHGFDVTLSNDAGALDGSDFDLCLIDHRL